MKLAAVKPFSSAAAYTNGLKFDPGWRRAWTTRLNFERTKSMPPTRARIAPSSGLSATSAPSIAGSCSSRQ